MRYRLLLIVLPILILSGCGQKGPLYLPDKQGESKTTSMFR